MLTHKLFAEGEYAILKDAKAQVEVNMDLKILRSNMLM